MKDKKCCHFCYTVLMPERITIPKESTAEQETPFEERRQALFDRIRKEAAKDRAGGAADTEFLPIARVFEHSTEDGLRLADACSLPPAWIQHMIFNPNYRLKHPKIMRLLVSEAAKTQGESPEEQSFRTHVRRAEEASDRDLRPSVLTQAITTGHQKRWAESKDPLENAIDTFYADVLRHRAPVTPRMAEQLMWRSFNLTRGERLAMDYLNDLLAFQEPRYYTGPIKERFRGFEQEPILQGPTITERELKNFLEKYKEKHHLDPDAIIPQFKNARVFAYRQLETAKKNTVLSVLKKEVKDVVPEGWEVVLDHDADEYKIVRKNAEKKDKESSEMTRDAYEAMVVKEFDKLEWEEGERVNIAMILSMLTGIDTPDAWNVRRRYLRFYPGDILRTLKGIDSKDAWDIRTDVGRGDPSLQLSSTEGLDSAEAWQLREPYLKSEFPAHRHSGLQTLRGVDSPRAWTVRAELAKKDPAHVIASITGMDSPAATEMRRRLFKTWPKEVVMSTVGLQTPEAEMLRKSFILNRPDYVQTYVGSDTPKAWRVREMALAQVFPRAVAYSLRGLHNEKASDMRRRLRAISPELYAHSFNGDDILLRQLPWKKEEKPGEGLDFALVDVLVKTMNLVRKPETENVRAYLDTIGQSEAPLQKKRHRTFIGHSPRMARMLADPSRLDRETAAAYLKNNPAMEDRAPELLVQELMRRMVPYRRAARTTSLWQSVKGLFGGGTDGLGIASENTFLDRPETELIGAGGERLADTRPVVESRDAMETLLTSGIYGRYSKASKRWEKLYFPVRRDPAPPARATTLTVPNVTPGSRITLPIPPDGRLIPERVHALTASGKEIPVTPELNCLGEAAADVPNGAVKMLYSIEQPLAFAPMEDVPKKDYDAFAKRFAKTYGRGIAESLARLPQDLRAELRRESFLALPPKERVERVEAMVRRLGYYDVNNDEVARTKAGVGLEEQMMMAERRLGELRAGTKNPAPFEGKRFAGVCADFAQITCAALREAGIMAGVLSGVNLRGKKAEMRNSHATAFVPWPTADGGIRIIPVDGTPSDGAGMLAASIGVVRPTIAEREAVSEEAAVKELEQSREVIERLLADLKAGKAEDVRKLSNGVLERAANVMLTHDVTRANVRALTRLINAYWYGGLERRKGRKYDLEIQKALEWELIRERKEATEQDAREPAGKDLMDAVHEFIQKYTRAYPDASHTDAIDTLEHIVTLAKKELTPTEYRVVTAVVGYLRAKKMR